MILVVLASVTGLVLYVHVYHQGVGGWLYDPMRVVEAWMGGLATCTLYSSYYNVGLFDLYSYSYLSGHLVCYPL